MVELVTGTREMRVAVWVEVEGVVSFALEGVGQARLRIQIEWEIVF